MQNFTRLLIHVLLKHFEGDAFINDVIECLSNQWMPIAHCSRLAPFFVESSLFIILKRVWVTFRV